MKLVFIYVLIDPRDGRIRYVGKCVDPRKRITAHWAASSVSFGLVKWLKELRDLGMRPRMKIVEAVSPDKEEYREFLWWKKLSERGYRLLNVNPPYPSKSKTPQVWPAKDLVDLYNDIEKRNITANGR